MSNDTGSLAPSLVQLQVTSVLALLLRLQNFQRCGLDCVSDAEMQKDRSQSSMWDS